MKPFRIFNVVGARPNMMKVAPLIAEMQRHADIKPILVHTGQHYDYAMSEVFFDQLQMPKPDYNLEVVSGTHARRRCGTAGLQNGSSLSFANTCWVVYRRNRGRLPGLNA